jgi:hypothetical protein
MPIMDGRGYVVCGGGGLQGSLWTPGGDPPVPFPFATYGGGCWLDDVGTAIEQLRDPAPGTLAFCRANAGPALLARGANDWAGGGGAFVAWLAGFGIWGSLESRFQGTPDDVRDQLRGAGTCGPWSVAPDGTIAYVPDRQKGIGIAMVDVDGRVIYSPGIIPYDVQVIAAGVAIWRGGAVGRPPTRPTLADAQGVQLQSFGGADWILYWSESRGCVLQPDGDRHGFILDARPLEFNPHMRVVGGELWIAWSTTQGERPEDLVVCAMTAQGAIRYVRAAAGIAPAVPAWVDLSAPVTPPVEPPIEPPIQPPIEPPPTKPPIEPPPVKPPIVPATPYAHHAVFAMR